MGCRLATYRQERAQDRLWMAGLGLIEVVSIQGTIVGESWEALFYLLPQQNHGCGLSWPRHALRTLGLPPRFGVSAVDMDFPTSVAPVEAFGAQHPKTPPLLLEEHWGAPSPPRRVAWFEGHSLGSIAAVPLSALRGLNQSTCQEVDVFRIKQLETQKLLTGLWSAEFDDSRSQNVVQGALLQPYFSAPAAIESHPWLQWFIRWSCCWLEVYPTRFWCLQKSSNIFPIQNHQETFSRFLANSESIALTFLVATLKIKVSAEPWIALKATSGTTIHVFLDWSKISKWSKYSWQ